MKDWQDHYSSIARTSLSNVLAMVKKLDCTPGFIAVMLSDISDAFNKKQPVGENSCGCC